MDESTHNLLADVGLERSGYAIGKEVIHHFTLNVADNGIVIVVYCFRSLLVGGRRVCQGGQVSGSTGFHLRTADQARVGDQISVSAFN